MKCRIGKIVLTNVNYSCTAGIRTGATFIQLMGPDTLTSRHFGDKQAAVDAARQVAQVYGIKITDLEVRNPEPVPDVPARQPCDRDDFALAELLAMAADLPGRGEAGFDTVAVQISRWSDEHYRQAEEWAGAVHLAASDNDVPVPAEPEHVAELEHFHAGSAAFCEHVPGPALDKAPDAATD